VSSVTMSSSSGPSLRKSRIAASVSNVMYTNAVYFPNYRVYRGDSPGQLNYGCINHVYYAFATVSPDGGVLVSYDPLPMGNVELILFPDSSATCVPIYKLRVTVSTAQ
jgi:GH18 family chitinase